MSQNIKTMNRGEERAPQCEEAVKILRENYQLPVSDKEGIVLATSFRDRRPLAFVPVAPHSGDFRVQVDSNGLMVDGSEVSEFLVAQLHDAEIQGHLYYVVDLKAGHQPDFLELAFLEFGHDLESMSPSLKVTSNRATIIKATGAMGKPIKGYLRNATVPLRVVATRREAFARMKINPQLQGIYDELQEG